MKQLHTQGIILSRTDYGEADRIITVLTSSEGKLRLMAKGVRREKSKLAGGIELFSISELTYISGKREIHTLISTRLVKHYGNIIQAIERVQLGYELIKILNRITEDHTDPAHFNILVGVFDGLDDANLDLELIRLWFYAKLIRLSGHQPNLKTDISGNKLLAGESYKFDFNDMAFMKSSDVGFNPDSIKVLRLFFGDYSLIQLSQIIGIDKLLPDIKLVVGNIFMEFYN